MIQRFRRIATTLVAVLGGYFLYAFSIVPWIEPAARGAANEHTNPSVTGAIPGQIEKLRPYFAEGDWELQNPIMIENSEFAVLLKDYESLPGGRVRIQPCTLLFFPDGRPIHVDLPHRFIIMQAPEGAILDFDQDCDFARAKVGRLLGGRLTGKVAIRGKISSADSTAPQTADELQLVTHDVEISPERLWTPNEVRIQLGANHGRGQELEIAFAGAAFRGGANDEPATNSIQTIQINRNVHLYGEIASSEMMPGLNAKKMPMPKGSTADEQPPPVEIRCDGPLQLHVSKMAATFNDNVDVLRLNRNGESDQLNCQTLTVFFAPTETSADPDDPEDKRTPKSGFDISKIDARGNPVTVRWPSAQCNVRGEHLQLDLATNRLELDGEQQVHVRYGDNTIHAASVQYQSQANSTMGIIDAKGPGRIKALLPGDKKSEIFEAKWDGRLQVRPNQGKQLISLVDKANIQYANTGQLAAEEIWFWVVEQPQRQPISAQADPKSRQSQFVPNTLIAQRDVQLNAMQLNGNTDRLEVWFEPPAVDKPNRSASSGQSKPRPNQGHTKGPAEVANHSYNVRGGLIRVEVALAHKGNPILRSAVLSRGVELEEQSANGQPLSVKGEHVQLIGIDTPSAIVTATGKPAFVAARGLTLAGPSIRMDQQTNRLDVEGAGNMTLPMDRDLQGRKTESTDSLYVSWKRRMAFDGKTIDIEEGVSAQTSVQRLLTENLQVTLSQPVQFGQPVDTQQVDIAQINCSQAVMLDSYTRTGGKRTSWERMAVQNLSVDRASGKVLADGPGWISTVRRGTAVGQLRPAGAAAQQSGGLTFLKVVFQQAMTGNLHQGNLNFADQVRCIYGPVQNWDAKLDPENPGGAGPNEVLLNCDQLTVTQLVIPAAKTRHFQLAAIGNPQIEGETFSATGDRVTYSTAKDLLILEGTGHADAQLWRQQSVGSSRSRVAARKILYWNKSGRIEVQDVSFGGGAFSAGK